MTTGHTRSQLVDLQGTVVLNYDISGPASQLGSTGISVYVTDKGINGTNTTTSMDAMQTSGELELLASGNSHAGVVDLDEGFPVAVNPLVKNSQ